LGQILPLVLRDGSKPHVHCVESLGLGANQLEQVAVDDAVDVGGKLDRGFLAKTGETIGPAA
jgi:hypothetical protein